MGQTRTEVSQIKNASVLSGFRNKLINGDFAISQRGDNGGAQSGNRYMADRWKHAALGTTVSFSRPSGLVVGAPSASVWQRLVVASVAGVSNFAILRQHIENHRTLAGKKATLTFYAASDAIRNIYVELSQAFGSGGSPEEIVPGKKITLSNAFTRYDVVFDLPSAVGKTVGAGDALLVNFWIDAGADYNARTANLGQQSGTFSFAYISLVEGDATAEDDPFSQRPIQQELALCQRYFEAGYCYINSYAASVSGTWNYATRNYFKVDKRVTPTIAATNPQSANVGSNVIIDPDTRGFLHQVGANAVGNYSARLNWLADSEF